MTITPVSPATKAANAIVLGFTGLGAKNIMPKLITHGMNIANLLGEGVSDLSFPLLVLNFLLFFDMFSSSFKLAHSLDR